MSRDTEDQRQVSSKTSSSGIAQSDMPALYRSADIASIRAQQNYFWLVRVELAFLFTVAAASAISIGVDSIRKELALSGAAILALTIIFTSIRRIARPERQWYESRALAESVKTVAWRYMMCAEPYQSDVEAAQVDKIFAEALSRMLAQQSNVFKRLGGEFASDPQITKKMRYVRSLDSASRKSTYLSERIQDQRQWYAGKAGANRSMETIWFVAMVAAEGLALIFAIVFALWSEWSVNPAAILAGLAVAFLAWLQVKRHNELTQSYAMAAHELGLIYDQALHARTDEELSKFVSDAENAMSREHTMWLARKDAA